MTQWAYSGASNAGVVLGREVWVVLGREERVVLGRKRGWC